MARAEGSVEVCGARRFGDWSCRGYGDGVTTTEERARLLRTMADGRREMTDEVFGCVWLLRGHVATVTRTGSEKKICRAARANFVTCTASKRMQTLPPGTRKPDTCSVNLLIIGDNSDGITVMTLYTGIVGYTALPTQPYVLQRLLANERLPCDGPMYSALTRPWGVH